MIVAFHLALAYSSNLIFKLAGLTKFQIPPGYFSVTLIIISLLISFSFPFYFKFGPTKAMSILTFSVMGVFYGVMFAVGKKPELVEKIRNFSFTDVFTTSLLLTGIAVLLFVVSIKVSIAIYSKRDLL